MIIPNNIKNIPWVEKYRPTKFEDIVLDSYNKKIFNNILETDNFPNLLLHGPPGIGKTTTIINLINNYQSQYNQRNKSLIIHLNASDERGIDIIRNNIYNFVNSTNLFHNGIKFVILDEVDYMTKCAQQALKSLINESNLNVRYCLICNYISKIDNSLQNEFVKIRFNKLPISDIYDFINVININESLNISESNLYDIIKMFDYDIRSMINYIQANSFNHNLNILDNNIYNNLFDMNINKKITIKDFTSFINDITDKYKIYKKNILKDYINFVILNKSNIMNTQFLNDIELLIHQFDNSINFDNNIKYIYFLIKKYH